MMHCARFAMELDADPVIGGQTLTLRGSADLAIPSLARYLGAVLGVGVAWIDAAFEAPRDRQRRQLTEIGAWVVV